MFYYIVSNLPFIKSIDDDSKFFKILVIGSICYVVLHAILFSNIGENIELIKKYRKYLYYLWGADTVLSYVYVRFFAPPPPINSSLPAHMLKPAMYMDDNVDDEDSDSSSSEEIEVKHLTREQIVEQLRERDEVSPFVKRNEVDKQNAQSGSATSGTTLHMSSPPNDSNTKAVENKEQVESDTDIPEYKEE
jgi:hypothetical protein